MLAAIESVSCEGWGGGGQLLSGHFNTICF